ncbi:MAG: insulinase family protein [Acidobacteria bacterium]|nr:insulinase family protein [Acidobacteriota bacterium]
MDLAGRVFTHQNRRQTGNHAIVLDEQLETVFDVLSDLVLHPLFQQEEISRERSVILEEIKSEEDNPDYLLHEIFTQNFWKGHALGKPILGTRETVGRLKQDVIREQFTRIYRPNNMVISAAGHLEHSRLVQLAEQRFHSLKKQEVHLPDSQPATHSRITLRNKKSLEQVYLCLGVPSYSLSHDGRYACYVLNTLLGGGMSSRLFQNIRERQGLAYSVFSDLVPYKDTGCLFVYAATSPETAAQVVRSIVQEFRELKENAVDAEELRRAKDHLKGSLMLSLESTGSRMSSLARQYMNFGKFFTLDEIIAKIEAVTAEDLMEIARKFFRTEDIALTVLGRLDGLKIGREMLAC